MRMNDPGPKLRELNYLDMLSPAEVFAEHARIGAMFPPPDPPAILRGRRKWARVSPPRCRGRGGRGGGGGFGWFFFPPLLAPIHSSSSPTTSSPAWTDLASSRSSTAASRGPTM